MKRLLLTLAAVIAMLAVVFAVGPRVSVDETLRPVALPEDLDGYLARSEARFADLRTGRVSKPHGTRDGLKRR